MVLRSGFLRDLAKTGTFATLHFGVGFGVTYALTGSIAIATGVALIEPAVNFSFMRGPGPGCLLMSDCQRYFQAKTGCSRCATRVERPLTATSLN